MGRRVEIKVLLPLRTRSNRSADGHRVEHLAGDPDGVRSAGVGVLLTGPPTWLVYAAPNEHTHPYVIATYPVDGSVTVSVARAILARFPDREVEAQRRRMPQTLCARCGEATPIFMVSDAAWARVGPKWVKKILCESCYEEVTT